MDTAMPEEKLRDLFDRITRGVTADSGGIRLVRGERALEDDLCTVHVSFQKGFHSTLSLRADTSMLTRLTQSILQEENVTPQDLEDVTKEYFNVLCGHIAGALYKATQIASRFSVPFFHHGNFNPENHMEQFALNYFSDRNEAAQLVHLIPVRHPQEDGEAPTAVRIKSITKKEAMPNEETYHGRG